jgi:hypothetical protein
MLSSRHTTPQQVQAVSRAVKHAVAPSEALAIGVQAGTV